MTSGQRKLATIALVVLLLAGTAVAYRFGDRWFSPEQLAQHLRGFGLWAPVIVIGLMVLHSFVPFPAEILALCAGAVFGTLIGTGLIWIGAMLGAVVAFGLARVLGQAVVRRWLSERQAAELDQWMNRQGAVALLVSRLVPVIAFNLINYAAGLSPVRSWTFLWTTALGILPITVLSTYLGAHMKTLTWSMLFAVSAIGIVLVVAVHRLAQARHWI